MYGFASAGSAALVAVNTTLAPAAGGISAMLLRRFVLEPKSWNVTYVCGGILGGLVSITAGCGNIHPRGTIIVGLIGGVVYVASSELLQKLKIDDPVEAFPVHGACGIWGVIVLLHWHKFRSWSKIYKSMIRQRIHLSWQNERFDFH